MRRGRLAEGTSGPWSGAGHIYPPHIQGSAALGGQRERIGGEVGECSRS